MPRPVPRILCEHVLPLGTRTRHFSSFTKHLPFRPLPRPHLRLGSNPFPRHAPRQQHRNAASFKDNARALWREYPYSVSLASALILFGAGTLVYVNYFYRTYILAAFHKYPEPVAQKLRRALFYTNADLQPKEAVKYYKQALQVADELGMDPFSDEIIGVKVQVAALMEKIENFPKAIQVLEILRADCIKWEEELGGLERNRAKRTRVLAKTVAISLKLGELYSNKYIQDDAAAQERLEWAVETALRESARRQKEGVPEDDSGWITTDHLGASLEALAHNFEGKNMHHYATPLFLQALALKEHQDCHTVVLMNNLAISISQQVVPATQGEIPPPRSVLVDNARAWAQKALDLAATIEPPVRDEECDMGCAVALHNLGEFAEMNSNLDEAAKKYREAASLARAIGFIEGLQNSNEGLKRISKAAGHTISNL